MPLKPKQTGKANSVPVGLTMGVSVSIFLTLLLSIIIANFIHKEKITWEQAGYWIMYMLYLSSFIGGKVAYASIKRQRFIITMMAGVLYWGFLLCVTALFFGGKYEAVLVTAGIIGAGCGTAALIQGPTMKKSRIK